MNSTPYSRDLELRNPARASGQDAPQRGVYRPGVNASVLWHWRQLQYRSFRPARGAHDAAQVQAQNNQVANPFNGIIPNSSATTSQYQLDCPYPQFGGLDIASPPWANANYQALQLGLEKRFSNGLQFLFTYVWSKSIDDDSNPGNSGGSSLGNAPAPVDPNNLKLARSVSQYNIPQVFQFSYDYHLPFGRGQHFGATMNRVLDAIVGGWQTTGIWRFDDGQPMIWSLSASTPGMPGYGRAPNLVGTPHANPKSQWFSVAGWRVLCQSAGLPTARGLHNRRRASNHSVDALSRHVERGPVALQGIFPEQGSRRHAPRTPYGMVQRLKSPAIRQHQ